VGRLRHRRARREDGGGRRAARRDAGRVHRARLRRPPAHLDGARPRRRPLRAHHRCRPRPQRAGGPPAGVRRGLDRDARVRGALLRRVRALRDRARPRGRPLPRPRDPAGAAPRDQLLLRDEPPLRLAARAHPGRPVVHPARALPQRGARHAARRIRPRRPLDLAAQVAARVGHRAPLRSRPRLLRVVRRAALLPDRRGLRRREALGGAAAGLPCAMGERAPPDRQGHLEAACDLLADDAARDGLPALPLASRPRLLEGRRPQGLQEPRQHDLAARHARALRIRGLPLVPAARDELRSRCELHRGGARRARERRPGEQRRQSREPDAEPRGEALRRLGPGGGAGGRRGPGDRGRRRRRARADRNGDGGRAAAPRARRDRRVRERGGPRRTRRWRPRRAPPCTSRVARSRRSRSCSGRSCRPRRRRSGGVSVLRPTARSPPARGSRRAMRCSGGSRSRRPGEPRRCGSTPTAT
jgi:hypothetical protein